MMCPVMMLFTRAKYVLHIMLRDIHTVTKL